MLASDGDFFLGGDDLDRALAEVLAAECNRILRFDPRPHPVLMMKLMMGAEAIKCHLSENDAAEGEIDGIDLPNGQARLAAVRAHPPAVRGADQRLRQPHDRGHQAGARRRRVCRRGRSATCCASAARRASRSSASGSPRCSAASPTSRSTPTRSSRRAPRSRPARLSGSIIAGTGMGARDAVAHRRALAAALRRRAARARPAAAPGAARRQPVDARDPDRRRLRRAAARQERADPDRAHARVHDRARQPDPRRDRLLPRRIAPLRRERAARQARARAAAAPSRAATSRSRCRSASTPTASCTSARPTPSPASARRRSLQVIGAPTEEPGVSSSRIDVHDVGAADRRRRRAPPPHQLLEIPRRRRPRRRAGSVPQDRAHRASRSPSHRRSRPTSSSCVTAAYATVANAYQTFRSQAMQTHRAIKRPERPATVSGAGDAVWHRPRPRQRRRQRCRRKALVYYRKAELALQARRLKGALLQLKMAIATDPQSAVPAHRAGRGRDRSPQRSVSFWSARQTADPVSNSAAVPRTTTGTAITGHGVWHPDTVLDERRAVRRVQRVRPPRQRQARGRDRRGHARAAQGIDARVRRQGVGHHQALRRGQDRPARSRADVPEHPGPARGSAQHPGRVRGQRRQARARARRPRRRGRRPRRARRVEPPAPLPGDRDRGPGRDRRARLRLRHVARLLGRDRRDDRRVSRRSRPAPRSARSSSCPSSRPAT